MVRRAVGALWIRMDTHDTCIETVGFERDRHAFQISQPEGERDLRTTSGREERLTHVDLAVDDADRLDAKGGRLRRNRDVRGNREGRH